MRRLSVAIVSTRAGEHSWSWNGIGCEATIEIEFDSWVGGRVNAGEADGRWRSRATTRNVECVAGDVELSTTNGASNVKSNNLSSEQVLACWDARGDSEGIFAAVGIQAVSRPVVVALVAGLGNLEPSGRGSRCGQGVVDLGHVNDDGTIVVATNGLVAARAVSWLLMHFYGDCAACCDITEALRCPRADIASNIATANAGYRAVTQRRADASSSFVG